MSWFLQFGTTTTQWNTQTFKRLPDATDRRVIWAVTSCQSFVNALVKDEKNDNAKEENDNAKEDNIDLVTSQRYQEYFMCLVADETEALLHTLTVSLPRHEGEEVLTVANALRTQFGLNPRTLELFRVAYNDLVDQCRSYIASHRPFDEEQSSLVVVDS